VKEIGVLKLSIKGLKIDAEHGQNISFEELYKLFPNNGRY
jgi:hypothetical protein